MLVNHLSKPINFDPTTISGNLVGLYGNRDCLTYDSEHIICEPGPLLDLGIANPCAQVLLYNRSKELFYANHPPFLDAAVSDVDEHVNWSEDDVSAVLAGDNLVGGYSPDRQQCIESIAKLLNISPEDVSSFFGPKDSVDDVTSEFYVDTKSGAIAIVRNTESAGSIRKELIAAMNIKSDDIGSESIVSESLALTKFLTN